MRNELATHENRTPRVERYAHEEERSEDGRSDDPSSLTEQFRPARSPQNESAQSSRMPRK